LRLPALSRSRALPVGFVGVAMLLGACGGSTATGTSTAGTGSASCLADSKALVAAASKPLTFGLPSPAFNMSVNKGKTIWLITPTIANEINLGVANGVSAAAAAAGMTAHIWDGKNQPPTELEGMNEAVAQHAAGIILEDIPAQLVAQPIAAAKAAHIPVINWGDDDAGKPLLGVDARVPIPWTHDGEIMAAYVLSHSNCNTDAFVPYAAIAVNHVDIMNGFTSYFQKECPGCKVTSYAIDLPTFTTSVAPVVINAIQRDPKLVWIAPTFDYLCTFLVPALEAAGYTNKVKVISHDGNPTNINYIQKNEVQVADVALSPFGYQGWQTVDQIGRLMAGQPATDFASPVQLVSVDDQAAVGQLSASFGDYATGFKKLWGLS
jgi:ribose transport system substrate-binding protein